MENLNKLVEEEREAERRVMQMMEEEEDEFEKFLEKNDE